MKKLIYLALTLASLASSIAFATVVPAHPETKPTKLYQMIPCSRLAYDQNGNYVTPTVETLLSTV